MKKETVAKMIDHTLLAPTAGIRDIVKLCTQAEAYHFASVCINPYFVAAAKNELSNSDVHICTVVGFPLGSNTTEVKRFEAVSRCCMRLPGRSRTSWKKSYCKSDIGNVFFR